MGNGAALVAGPDRMGGEAMEESIRLGRIAGVSIGLNWSVLLVAWLLSWSLASHRLPTSYPRYSTGAYWVAGVGTALVFFMSLIAHEMGHALVARRHGVRVEGITLWLFGGVAKLGGEAATPTAEFRIAAVGPAVSVALARPVRGQCPTARCGLGPVVDGGRRDMARDDQRDPRRVQPDSCRPA